jgi:hypothetical protein
VKSVIYENVDEDSKSSEDYRQSRQKLIQPPVNTLDASPQDTFAKSKTINNYASKLNMYKHQRPVEKARAMLVNKDQVDSQCKYEFLAQFYSN